MVRRKGSIIDLLFVCIVMAVFAIMLITAVYLWDQITVPIK
jgi:flagellar basal body-associated protein FliL